MKKIFFFHGLGGNFSDEDLDAIRGIFQSYEIDFYSPSLDYQFFNDNPFFFKGVQEAIKRFNPDAVIGNSMGGNIAYHIGASLGLPTLCFNPALSEKTMSYSFFHKHYDYVSPASKEVIQILLATHDDVVDHAATVKFLNKRKEKKRHIIEPLQGKTHTLPFEVILKSIVDFSNKYIHEKETTDAVQLNEDSSVVQSATAS